MLVDFGELPQANHLNWGIYECYGFDWKFDSDYGVPGTPNLGARWSPHEQDIPKIDDAEPGEFMRRLRECMDLYGGDYGNVDYPEQVIEKFPAYAWDDRRYVIAGYWITKVGNPGFRWHKNGYYQGDLEYLGCEYLGDEPNIDQVFHWGSYEVVGGEEYPHAL